jgi:hypothetical protein
MTADDVAAEVPAYAAFVRDQVARLGRQHPLVKTQFFSEEIDSLSGMFPPARRALMQGTHPAQDRPQPGKIYALLLDVAGEDEEQQASGEAAAAANTKRDATALTVVEIDLSTLSDPLIKKPRYLVVARQMWIGLKQTSLYAAVRGQVEHWQPRHLVVDATGIGAGLASFLAAAFQSRVLPFVFNSASKSQLGWDFLAVIESGRFKDHADITPISTRFLTELEYTQLEAMPGPGRLIKWGAPQGLKVAGEYIHDDLVLSSALCAVLDSLEWSISGPSLIVQTTDPLKELSSGF